MNNTITTLEKSNIFYDLDHLVSLGALPEREMDCLSSDGKTASAASRTLSEATPFVAEAKELKGKVTENSNATFIGTSLLAHAVFFGCLALMCPYSVVLGALALSTGLSGGILLAHPNLADQVGSYDYLAKDFA